MVRRSVARLEEMLHSEDMAAQLRDMVHGEEMAAKMGGNGERCGEACQGWREWYNVRRWIPKWEKMEHGEQMASKIGGNDTR